ncbi:hypothetical protein QFC22_005256 [Naganishia vaughanmartiniae]|uniref:Uncharacterized protein n=1 Tax=Naganishia vaughanmartiniae TaxID=1424756 RepID=A0ACC2WVG7_9TREE|nr:hypothetical protein QFC22_005256 [Naganishia vaughanmartiniae]
MGFGFIAHTGWTTPISDSAAITVQPSSSSSTATSTLVQPEIGATQGPIDRRSRTYDEEFDGQRRLDSNLSQEDSFINLQDEDTDNDPDLRSPQDHPSEKDGHRADLPNEMLVDEQRISFVTSFITETLKDSCHHQMFEP